MKKIAIIPARSGSKGLPNKNVLLVSGKPLIAFSIEAALESKEFDKIIVTTDSQEYIDLLSHYPIDFIHRDADLATDSASSYVVIEDVLHKYKNITFDYFVLLQPTSPLRTAKHIIDANRRFESHFRKFDFLVSVSSAHKPTTLTRPIEQDETLKHFKLDYSNYARQNYSPEYSPNGAIFSAKPLAYLAQKHFYGKKCLAYFMDKESSIDIDDKLDFEYFYSIIQQRNKREILLSQIKQRIEYKKHLFSKIQEITFIGHSILYRWTIQTLGKYKITNLAISGIATQEYQSLILDSGLLKNVGNKTIIMLGTNDIISKNWNKEENLLAIQKLIDSIKSLNPNTVVYFLEISPTALRLDRNNNKIKEFNHYLKNNLKDIEWIDLYDEYSDKYGKLDLSLSDDGLHFNAEGYTKLYSILTKKLDNKKQ
ncbi:cytidylyltransferase domain-containing protein [Avibacterium paragallinarum]|uniref:cytidylyltransferase domain-containing protein n=1 Tax=Avibacterium paragallinarum TaxID=728 RepID=UPI00021AD56F|nr:GDSL-type esterase/lipase family protein [Avibacterium paragallinarum]